MSTTVDYSETKRAGISVRELRLSSRNGLNPLSIDAGGSLRDRLAKLDHREGPNALVLCAAGRAFSAGADLGEIRGMSPDDFGQFMRTILDL